MAEELADLQNSENQAVQEATIPDHAPEKPEKAPSLREALTASIKEVGEKEQRVRDAASGKFIPKDKVEAKESSKESPKQPTKEPAIAPEASQPEGVPSSWSKEAAPLWETLPQGVKDEVRKRESDFLKGIEKYKSKASQHDEIAQALSPVRPVLQQYGIANDAQAVSRLVEWESALRNPQTRMQAFANLIQTYGIDPSQFARNTDSTMEVPEQLRPVLDQFGQLSQTVNSVQNQISSWQQEQVTKDLAQFSKDKPHFERVRVKMGQLMQAGLVSPDDLNKAYEQAVWSDPDLRDELLKEQDEKRKAEFARTQAEQAKNARLAAVSPPPRARQGAPQVNDKSSKGIRNTILSSINELRDRA